MQQSRWNVLVPVGCMCMLGAALSVALIVQHAGESSAACSAKEGGCDAVQSSRWAVFPPAESEVDARQGIPVAAWGLGYFTFLAAWLLLAGAPAGRARYWHFLPTLAALGGGALSVVLVGIMWQSGHWCPLCVAVQGLNLTVLVSLLWTWPRGLEAEDEAEAASTPLARLAVSVVGLGICAGFAGAFYSGQLRLDHERQVLANRLDQLQQDTDVIGWLYRRQEPQTIEVRDDDLSLGAAAGESAATLVVFSDAHCHYCQIIKQRLDSEVLPAFNGRLRVVFKHFPLCGDCNAGAANVHPQACRAAHLAEAARLQGGNEAALKMLDLLKKPRSAGWSDADITAFAEQAGLDAARLLQDAFSATVQDRVAADAAAGRTLGVRAIPALFLDGREVTQDLWESAAFWQLAAKGNLSKSRSPASPETLLAAKTPPPTATPVPAAAPSTALTKEQRAAHAAATEMLKEHDADESGQLEKAEWKAMSFNPQPYDGNKDGIVTKEELIASIVSVDDGSGSIANPDAPRPEKPKPKLSTIEIGQELEIAGPTHTGAQFDLKDQRGKVVIVAFGASWCGFCVEETPYLQRLYEKYHDQGLEIVGVNADNSLTDLQQFVDQNHLPWPQIYFDAEGQRGRDNPVLQQHLIRGLPQIYVVDRAGKVAAQMPRRHDVEAAVAAALGVTATPVEQADAEVKEFSKRLVRPSHVSEPSERTVTVGQTLDITGTTLEGQEFDVKSWRGKPVLVAFWASWCPHCKQEMPNLQAAYQRHHADGLEIIGISADRSLGDVQKYLADNPQPWPTLYRDEDGYRGFDHPLIWKCGLDGVPAVYLLDRDGKVVSVKARGPEMEREVAKLLGKAPAPSTQREGTRPVATNAGDVQRPSTNPFDYSDDQLASNIIERFDANKDGVIQADEAQAMPNQGQGIDKDKDGVITRQEFAATIAAAKQAPGARQVVAAKVETNRMSSAEIAAEILKRYDKDKSGRLEAAEWAKMPGKPQIFDKDADTVITLEEIVQAMTLPGGSKAAE